MLIKKEIIIEFRKYLDGNENENIIKICVVIYIIYKNYYDYIKISVLK